MSGIKRKIALYQGGGVLGGVAENLEIMREAVSEAKLAGAELVIFPELILSGYNLGAQTPALAEAADGAAAKRVADMARSYGIAIVYGYPERDGEGIFNSSQFFTRSGASLLNYRKCQLYGPWEKDTFETGDGFQLADWEGLKVGLLICYDIEFPEAARCLAAAGADLILVSSATPAPQTEVSEVLLPARACENQVFVVFCNRCGREGDLVYCGGSCVVGPDGRDRARVTREEGLLFAEIDSADIARQRDIYCYLDDLRREIYRA
ncbi:MAG TPA: carbon-nitrogen hydrolase family protein [Kiloniellaceae bacterium]|nr:carbon-nitrogen hydrolase family protein [Kiloniellaceae bacterium]